MFENTRPSGGVARGKPFITVTKAGIRLNSIALRLFEARRIQETLILLDMEERKIGLILEAPVGSIGDPRRITGNKTWGQITCAALALTLKVDKFQTEMRVVEHPEFGLILESVTAFPEDKV